MKKQEKKTTSPWHYFHILVGFYVCIIGFVASIKACLFIYLAKTSIPLLGSLDYTILSLRYEFMTLTQRYLWVK